LHDPDLLPYEYEPPGWAGSLLTLKHAAGWLGCSVFELQARIDQGETFWLAWASVLNAAQAQAMTIKLKKPGD
jgi:hypothetical protein